MHCYYLMSLTEDKRHTVAVMNAGGDVHLRSNGSQTGLAEADGTATRDQGPVYHSPIVKGNYLSCCDENSYHTFTEPKL